MCKVSWILALMNICLGNLYKFVMQIIDPLDRSVDVKECMPVHFRDLF